MSSAYRSAYDHIVGSKLEETREARLQIAPHLPMVRKVVQARLARILAGVVGIAGAAGMALTAAITSTEEMPTDFLVGSSAALVFAWVAGRFLFHAGDILTPHQAAEPVLTGELHRDLELIAETDARREARALEARADRLETASIALPLIGISFLMPLFLHWCIGHVFQRSFASPYDYAWWIRASLAIVGHAHVALAILCWLFARKLHKADLGTMGNLKIHREWAKIWLIVIGVSCVPGLLFFAVPPVIVAFTGLAFIPFMVAGMKDNVQKERVWIAAMYPEHYEIKPGSIRIEEAASASAEEQEREADGDDEDSRADTGDRAEA